MSLYVCVNTYFLIRSKFPPQVLPLYPCVYFPTISPTQTILDFCQSDR